MKNQFNRQQSNNDARARGQSANQFRLTPYKS
jgi:hypothetical protein